MTCFLGLDFGTESVRAVLVGTRGESIASAVAPYKHGQIVPGAGAIPEPLRTHKLPPHFALQHPGDWIESAAAACRSALGDRDPAEVAGIGVDFTSCTMLPCRADGSPLCAPQGVSWRAGFSALAHDPHAWPKLWKHHGAITQTEKLNRAAKARHEQWLSRYGGIIGLEWLWPKMLEIVESSDAVAREAELYLEAGDWFVWQLIGAPSAGGRVSDIALPRSTCQAGYKGLWSATQGWPSLDYLTSVDPRLAEIAMRKLPGAFIPPGRCAGELCESIAREFGLRAGTPVSAAVIDAHAGVPGAGVGEAGTLVMVMGTSGCHMLLSKAEREVPGVAGVVKDGILPGFFGYETGQAAMGDSFDFVRRLTGQADFKQLDAAATTIAPGCDGITCLDWFNGCRTPLMDGSLKGLFSGLRLDHGAPHLYRAALEASAFGLKWIVETLRHGGVPVTRFVATGGLPTHNPLFVHIVADTLEQPIVIHAAAHGPALGAAILGACAAGSSRGGFDDIATAVRRMAGDESTLPKPTTIAPQSANAGALAEAYTRYRELAREQSRRASVIAA